ncbi:MAG: hypothetical protein GY694_14665 [Gammaproteobacteria bacterium]|nr:hypothetical protein [Gammaproteobacteria bacterium]
MSYAIAFTLHLIGAVIWVGGMFFAHMVLRPSAVEKLEPPQRLPLWVAVFGRFFFWVWIAVGTILFTGYWMVFDIFGGLAGLKANYIHIMHGIGLIMSGIYAYIFFIPYQQLKEAVANKEYPTGGALMNKIRQLVTTNLVLGLITVIIASGGKYVNF